MQYNCFKDDELIATFDDLDDANQFVDLVARDKLGHFEIKDDTDHVIWDRINDHETAMLQRNKWRDH